MLFLRMDDDGMVVAERREENLQSSLQPRHSRVRKLLELCTSMVAASSDGGAAAAATRQAGRQAASVVATNRELGHGKLRPRGLLLLLLEHSVS